MRQNIKLQSVVNQAALSAQQSRLTASMAAAYSWHHDMSVESAE